MTNLLFLSSILAVYSASLIISKLGGPAGIFRRLRRNAKGSLKEGLQCPICTGTWLSALCVAYLAFLGHIPLQETPLYLFAITGGSSLLHLLDGF